MPRYLETFPYSSTVSRTIWCILKLKQCYLSASLISGVYAVFLRPSDCYVFKVTSRTPAFLLIFNLSMPSCYAVDGASRFSRHQENIAPSLLQCSSNSCVCVCSGFAPVQINWCTFLRRNVNFFRPLFIVCLRGISLTATKRSTVIMIAIRWIPKEG